MFFVSFTFQAIITISKNWFLYYLIFISFRSSKSIIEETGQYLVKILGHKKITV